MKEVIADCSGLNLQTIPGFNQIPNTTTKLLLNFNLLSGSINTSVFKHLTHLTYLDLSFNHIEKIFVYEDLAILKYLDITNNYLCLDNVSFPELLSGMVSLRVFKFGGPWLDTSCAPFKDQLNGGFISNMKLIEELSIDGFQNTFGPGFQHLIKLRILRIQNSNDRFNGSVTDDTFRVFNNTYISELLLQGIYI